MRVIAGSAKGRKLISPDGTGIRPTSDRMKEDLFNILAAHISGARFLDVFSGTGAIGIEALSRGADSAVFVDAASAPLINRNLALTGFTARAMVLKCDYAAALRKLNEKQMEFDFIFIDPPYNQGFVLQAAKLISDSHLLDPNGFFIAESASNEVLPPICNMSLYKVKRYSTSMFFFYQKEI